MIDRSAPVNDDLGIVPTASKPTRAALKQAAEENDLIVTCGGVSVGEEDHLRPAVEKEGRLDLWQIAMKPGKPLAFGEVFRADGSSAWFIGLPGNPVSSFVTFLLAVRPMLLRLQGASDGAAADRDSRRLCLPQPTVGASSFASDARRGGLDLFGTRARRPDFDDLGDGSGHRRQAIAPGDTVRYFAAGAARMKVAVRYFASFARRSVRARRSRSAGVDIAALRDALIARGGRHASTRRARVLRSAKNRVLCARDGARRGRRNRIFPPLTGG